MNSLTVQWQAISGVTHAWVAHCEGYQALCGRETPGFYGQLSGLRCAQCATAAGWVEPTGESSYLTPQEPINVDAMFNMMEKVRGEPRRIGPRTMREPQAKRPRQTFVPLAEPSIIAPPEPPRPETPAPALQAPDSREAYEALPVVEQRYWAPMMLARAGQDAIWDQGQETAGQFQERCYELLRTSAG